MSDDHVVRACADTSMPTQRRALVPGGEGETNGRRPSSWAILASALLPGGGQAMLGQRRALLYFAVEALALSSYGENTRVARRTRNQYRALALAVARAPFAPNGPAGDFDYYERMAHFAESGAFDLGVGGGILEPEVDSATFNGAIWLLARRTYWKDPSAAPARGSPEWTRAELFYLQRAIRPTFRWSWTGADAEYDQFRRLIGTSNDRNRAALTDLGIILGNHVLSAIDASVTVRLSQRETPVGRVRSVSVAIPFTSLPEL